MARKKVAKKGKGKLPQQSSANDGIGKRAQRRQHQREERQATGPKRHHGGEDAKAELRHRLQVKTVERKISRLNRASPVSEWTALLQELGWLQMAQRRAKPAVEAFKRVIDFQPHDPDFLRAPIVCMLMDNAKTKEATDMLKGPLYGPLLAAAGADLGQGSGPTGSTAASGQSTGAEVPLVVLPGSPEGKAATIGCYTLALLTYISVQVLEEHAGDPNKAAAAEQRLAKRLHLAHLRNPFIAEFLAFAPAFERHFPVELGPDAPKPPSPTEALLLEAQEYCCRYHQAAVWLDTDEGVRRFLRCTLFEADAGEWAEGAQEDTGAKEEAPLAGLPEPAAGPEPVVLAAWRRAREDALELWASEMSVEGGSSSEGAEEEEDQEDHEEEESSDASSGVVAAFEERMNVG